MKFILVLILSLASSSKVLALDLQPSDKAVQAIKSDDAANIFNLQKYEPMYFVYGNPTAKLQLSFKYQTVKVWPLYFGYNQVMFWELTKESVPMRDVNFNPEVFNRIELTDSIFENIDIGLFEHKSNGRDGVASRSFNRSYVRTNVLTSFFDRGLRVSAKLSYMYPLEKTNTDLSQHIGPLDLKLTLIKFIPWVLDRGEFYIRIIPGGRYSEHIHLGSREYGLSFRLGGLDLTPSIFIQYFTGYAESLLVYDKYEQHFRVGVEL